MINHRYVAFRLSSTHLNIFAVNHDHVSNVDNEQHVFVRIMPFSIDTKPLHVICDNAALNIIRTALQWLFRFTPEVQAGNNVLPVFVFISVQYLVSMSATRWTRVMSRGLPLL